MNLKIKFELEETELNGEIENLIPSSSGGSLPSGGTTGQVLTKNSDADGDAGWKDNKPVIPEPYVLPSATAETLGGVKIGNGISIAEDGTISASGGTTHKVEKTTDDTTAEFVPNTFYVFPEMTSLSVTFAAPIDTSVVNEYKFRFTSGATATTLTLPSTVVGDITIEANKVYEISVIDNYLVYQSWAVSA